MKALICAVYLVSGFVMLSVLHAETLDAPTLVYQEYTENFMVKDVGRSGRATRRAISEVRAYLSDHMKDVPSLKVDRLSRLIVKLSRQYKLPEGLILSIIKVESNFQPWAVSPRGALGLMQLMPETGEWLAKRCGIRWDGPATLLDEQLNTVIGVKYLAYLKDKYGGDLKKMLAAYNQGPAKVDEDVSSGKSLTLEYYLKIKQYLPKFALGPKQSQGIASTHVE